MAFGTKRLIVGITGASGAIYGIRMLEALKGRVETHLVVTRWAERTIDIETSYPLSEVTSLASFVYDNEDLAARISSGTFPADGMVVIPCSIRTLSAVANSGCSTLLDRAADVTLKERRRLVLAVRETPYHIGHLRLMERATEMGAVILPPVPAFYFRPSTVGELVNHTIGKILDLYGIELELFRKWKAEGEVLGSGSDGGSRHEEI